MDDRHPKNKESNNMADEYKESPSSNQRNINSSRNGSNSFESVTMEDINFPLQQAVIPPDRSTVTIDPLPQILAPDRSALPQAYRVGSLDNNIVNSRNNQTPYRHNVSPYTGTRTFNRTIFNNDDDIIEVEDFWERKRIILKKYSFNVFFTILLGLNMALLSITFLGRSNNNNNIVDKAKANSTNSSVLGIQNMSMTNNSHGINSSFNNTTANETAIENNHEKSSQNILENNATCFTDPIVIQTLEYEAYQRGDDSSITRTYHFCPNSVMKVFEFDTHLHRYIYTTGEVFPLYVFRPNVHIKCGFDGAISNNCTFTGGFFQIGLTGRPIYFDYLSNTSALNVTVEGFRFTGAIGGANIIVRALEASITIKNCHFHENNGIIANINTAQPITRNSTVHVQNCTFDNNSYSRGDVYFQGQWIVIPTIGSIISFNIHNPYSIIKTYVTNSIFKNNTYQMDPHGTNLTTGAIINLLPATTTLKVTNSCFIENRNYSSALILIGEAPSKPITRHGNTFINNFPKNELFESPCLLSYQSFNILNDGSLSMKVKETCDESFFTSYVSNGMCIL